MNKHGFTGVRKRNDGRRKPYYVRVTIEGGYMYSKSYETAEEAALEFDKYAAARAALSTLSPADGGAKP
jgi:hypothetical protein